MGIVFVRDTIGIAGPNGIPVRLVRNDAWDEESPVVRLRPELFAPEPPDVYGVVARDAYPGIEQVTAAPGERRRTR